VWSNDPDSYASGSVATGRASHVEQAVCDDPDNRGYPDWGLGVRLTILPPKTYLLRNFNQSLGIGIKTL